MNFKLKIFYKIILLAIFIKRNKCGKPCSKVITIKHGIAIDCEIKDGNEFVNLECDQGYEFEADISRKQVFTGSNLERINCNGKIYLFILVSQKTT